MKTKIAFFALMVLGTLLSGCASSDMLNNVRIGMTKDQVIALMGKPDSMSAQANVEYLTYYLISESGYGRDQPYMVRLVDGKVESFGRFLQLFDLYTRPVTSAKPGDPNFPTSPALGYGPSAVPVPGGPELYGPAAAPMPGGLDLAGEIERLKALKDKGVLTDEEFQKAKQKLLSEPK